MVVGVVKAIVVVVLGYICRCIVAVASIVAVMAAVVVALVVRSYLGDYIR